MAAASQQPLNNDKNISISAWVEKAKTVSAKKLSDKYNKKAYEKAKLSLYTCVCCNVDVKCMTRKQHEKSITHINNERLYDAELAATPRPVLLIKEIQSLLQRLKNDYCIVPEFIWNNVNPNMTVYVNDDSYVRCKEMENFKPLKHEYIHINTNKEVMYEKTIGCDCDVCYVESEEESESEEEAVIEPPKPQPKKIIIKKKPLMEVKQEPIIDTTSKWLPKVMGSDGKWLKPERNPHYIEKK
jgi:hypothetical protein